MVRDKLIDRSLAHSAVLWLHEGSGLHHLALGARLCEVLHFSTLSLRGYRLTVERCFVRIGPLQLYSLRILGLLALAMCLLDWLNDLERPYESLVFAHSLRKLGNLLVLAVPYEETLEVYVLVVGELVVLEGPAYLSLLRLRKVLGLDRSETFEFRVNGVIKSFCLADQQLVEFGLLTLHELDV